MVESSTLLKCRLLIGSEGDEYCTEVLHILAYMAYKIESHDVDNMLTDSPSIRKIL